MTSRTELERNTKYYDEYSEHYDSSRDTHYYNFLVDEEMKIVSQHTRGKKVLEIGCGTGVLMEWIQKDCNVMGVDLSPGMVRKAQKKGLVVVQGRAEELPHEADMFDVVYSFKTLPHVSGIAQALTEINRVLKRDGIAFVEFYNRHSVKYVLNKIAHFFFPRDFFIRYDTIQEIRAACAQTGFEVRNVYGIKFLFPHVFFRFRIVRWIEHVCQKHLSHFGSFIIFEVKKR